jgi:CelD/BcsL family acetyltransferase involved in cellulose biosynthesis
MAGNNNQREPRMMHEPRECATQTPPAAPAEPDALTAVTAASLSEVSALREQWLDLTQRYGLLSPWPHPDRYCAELRASPPGVNPFLMMFRDALAPRAMILGRTSVTRIACGLGRLRFQAPQVRLLTVGHGGLVSDGSEASRRAILNCLQELLVRRQADMIFINHLLQQDSLCASLLALGALPHVTEPHWHFDLVPGSYELTIGAFSGKQRREMRRMERVLADRFDGQVSVRRFERPEELEEMIAGCAAIAARTYQAGLGAGFTGHEPWHEILATEARQGRLRAYWLLCQGQPVAFQIGAVYRKVYFMDFMGYLPQHASLGLGSILHGRVIEDLCRDNLNGIDYGFGHAAYKQTYGTQACQETSLLLYGSGWRARITSAMLTSSTAASRMASACLQRLGLHEPLKRLWRRFQQGNTP